MKKIITNTSETFLEKYLNTPSPTGQEQAGQKVWVDYIKDYVYEVQTDYYGSAVGVINPGKKLKVVIEAHVDEISWFVNYITDDGIIYVIRNGGSDHQIAPSKRVKILTESGKVVRGVFGWPAIHTRRGDSEQTPKMDNIFIDVGCSKKKEVEELGVQVGDVIIFDDNFEILNKNKYVCRALDNRMGGFMIAEVARLLKENKKELPFTLYVANCVQEEVGLYGAQMMTQTLQPDIALITDVTHDSTTPMIDKKKEGDTKLGLGPVIQKAPSIQNNFRKLIIETAKKEKIQYQLAACSRSSGTDTDSFAYSNGGVVSALISLPLRYMHTTVEMVQKEDVEEVIDLIYATLLEINNKEQFKYF